MNKKLLLTAVSATLSLGILGACGVDNNRMNNDDDNDVNYSPVRYDRQDNGIFNNRDNDGFEPVRFDNNNTNYRRNDLDRDFNTDLIDNNRGANGIDPGNNGRTNGPTGNRATMKSGS